MSVHEQFWIALNRLHSRISAEVADALKAAELPPLDWYDLLWELEKADQGLTQKQLETRILLPQYSMSRLVARLEAQGLIERRENPQDRRGHLLAVTAAGRGMRAKVWAVYAPALETALDGLSEGQQMRQLINQMARLAARQSRDESRKA